MRSGAPSPAPAGRWGGEPQARGSMRVGVGVCGGRRAKYEDKLARERAQEERKQRMDDAVKDEQRRLMAQRRLEGMKRRSEELAQEARRTTQEAEAQAQIRNIRAKALAEMEGRMRVDRCAAARCGAPCACARAMLPAVC